VGEGRMRKILKGKKGISMILAALLLVVIVVIISVIVYAWSTGLLGSLMPGAPSVKEGLSMDAYTGDTSSGYVLQIRNVGTIDVTITGYYIEEAGKVVSGPNSYSQLISVNTVEPVTITEGAKVGTWAGFASGHSYTIKLITTKGTQFTFNIVA